MSTHREPSDLVKLLGKLAQQYGDSTCHSGYVMATHGNPILDVCYVILEALARDKEHAVKLYVDTVMMLPVPPILMPNGSRDGQFPPARRTDKGGPPESDGGTRG
jgi:hypothetical protein